MDFKLYTAKTVTDCMREIKTRIEAKPTKSRPAINGKTEKGGKFTISTTRQVLGRIPHTTHMNGTLTREKGVTTIDGHVTGGIGPRWRFIMLGVLIVISGTLIYIQELILGMAIFGMGFLMIALLYADYQNSEFLLMTIESKLKANPNRNKFKTDDSADSS